MAGSIRSVIAENGLEVKDVSDFWYSQGMRIDQQTKRVRGQLPDGRFCSSFGSCERDAVNEWLRVKSAYVVLKGE